jgi:hypothetical protein
MIPFWKRWTSRNQVPLAHFELSFMGAYLPGMGGGHIMQKFIKIIWGKIRRKWSEEFASL